MKHIRSTTTVAASVALLATGFAGAGTAQAATPNACAGTPGCKVVSTADIDGDGRADSVGFRVTTGADGGMKVTTRVFTARGKRLWTTTQTSRVDRNPSYYLRGVAAIDGARGREIVVKTDVGAHTMYYRVLTYRNGKLVTLQSPKAGYRWITDGSIWSDFSYQRTTSTGLKMTTRESIDEDRDGDFTQATYVSAWRNGSWKRLSTTKRYNVSPKVAHKYRGWVVPGMTREL
ncbi:hypothetical protein [Kribbia dieselivorans]|uniref:hypothetical protein n=1 Tax=Kribbia dieselivorans TaxID=331526 RepID=UPI000838CFD7|nr:hypothetical protein [Kribbia dieselivorans]